MSTPTLAVDQAHLMHPLHHPSAYAGTRIWVKGQGAHIVDEAEVTCLRGARVGGDLLGDRVPVTPGPQVRERLQLVEGGIGYTDAGGRTYQFTVGMKIDGRNTGERTVYGFSVSFPLRLK